jgi:hypothetical protein
LDRKPSLWVTLNAVLWGFLGVRRGSDYQKDIARLNPVHLLVVGVVLAFVFVGVLMLVVKWVVSS